MSKDTKSQYTDLISETENFSSTLFAPGMLQHILLHALREKMLQGTEYAIATTKTIRLRLIIAH